VAGTGRHDIRENGARYSETRHNSPRHCVMSLSTITCRENYTKPNNGTEHKDKQHAKKHIQHQHTQNNNIQHNNTQQNNTQHNNTQNKHHNIILNITLLTIVYGSL
jgi:hypothetical protein